VSIQRSSPDRGPSPFQLELILSGVALVFSLFVVGVSLALAAAESKDERDILTIAGAPPGLLARMAGARAWLLAVLGAAMAVPVGFLPVIVFAKAQGQRSSSGGYATDFPLVFPTRTVLLLVVVVPLTVSLVSWLSSASAQRLRPLRVSTATFE
jgi:ABC-type lipoprotein release transport system permease subunit